MFNLAIITLLLAFGSSSIADFNRDQKSSIHFKKVDSKEASKIRLSLLTGQGVSATMGAESTDECEHFKSTLPKNYLQGYVEVPENSEDPKSPQIRVFYYGVLREGKPAVVFYNGGPGSDSHGSFQLMSRQSEFRNFSFIFIDQRGTGCSSQFPSEFSEATLKRLTHYGSKGIVLDSEAVRKKVLGADGVWKIFGQSYGGKIVHKYLTMRTENLMGAYSHGFSVMSDGHEWMLLRIQSQTRVLEDYLKEHPGDAELIKKIQSQISEDLCFTDGDLKVCGPKVVDGLVMYLGFRYTWPTMHSLINSMLDTEGKLVQTNLNRFVRQIVFGVYGNNYVAGSVIGMSDMSTGEPTFDFCAEPMKRLKERGQNPEAWTLNECRLLAGMANEKWDPLLKAMIEDKSILDETTLEQVKMGLEKNPRIPFYLYAGALDVFVPQETFLEEVQFLGSRINYSLFPLSGHEGFYSEPQIWQDLARP